MHSLNDKIIKKLIRSNELNNDLLIKIIKKEASKFKKTPPNKKLLLSAYHKLLQNNSIKKSYKLEQLLTKRAIRTQSGIAVISVLTKPYPCTGKCLYCPDEKEMPKSYLSNEPAVMRAILNNFDPYRQIKMRLKALADNGHNTSKIELIVMGGTWSCHNFQYQTWFIKRCFDALNERKTKNLEKAQKKNETAKHRCVGLTLETRPDYIDEKEIKRMRRLGCTRVELGIQHIDDKILKLNRRGHTSADSKKAIAMLRQNGFKLNFHLMLNLPGSTPSKDFKMFEKIYSDSEWMPDMIKIYPCVVTKNSALYKIWKKGNYRPYSNKELVKLIIKIKKITPKWVRITRLIRDIPKESIEAGNKITNLRQLIQQQAEREGWHCQCIRCREPGSFKNLKKQKVKNLKLFIEKYKADEGKEYFLSYESKDRKILFAFLRLKINNQQIKPIFFELKNAGIIRELHTYGQATSIGTTGRIQHIGLGKKLIKEAEKVCKKNNVNKIAVISGIGVREYYRKMDYEIDGSYMIKTLVNELII